MFHVPLSMLNLQVPSSPVTASQSVCSYSVRLLLLAVPVAVAGVVIESNLLLGPGFSSLFFLLWHPPHPPAGPGQACFFSLLHESLDLVMHGGGGSFE